MRQQAAVKRLQYHRGNSMIVMYTLKKYTPECKEYLDDVGFHIQRCGGSFHIGKHEIEFTFEDIHKDFILIKYPFLKEIPLCY